jgi:hypothetical protein
VAEHELYLIELAEDFSREGLAKVLKRCGPILDRDAVEAALQEGAELPIRVARADKKAQLFILAQLLDSGGCRTCVVEDTASVGVKERLDGLVSAAREAPRFARRAAAEVAGRTMAQVDGVRALVARKRSSSATPDAEGGEPGAEVVVLDEAAESEGKTLRLRPLAIALRLGLLLLLVVCGAVALTLLPEPPPTEVEDHGPREIQLLPQAGGSSLQASSGGASGRRSPGMRDSSSAGDPRATEGGEGEEADEAAPDEGPVEVPEILLRESEGGTTRVKRSSQVDLAAFLLGIALATSTMLLLPRSGGGARISSSQGLGVALTAALLALIWAEFVVGPKRAESAGESAGVVLTGGGDGRIAPDEAPDATAAPPPERPFTAFVETLGGEPSTCDPDLPRFAGLLCDLREMGATAPMEDPGDALAAGMEPDGAGLAPGAADPTEPGAEPDTARADREPPVEPSATPPVEPPPDLAAAAVVADGADAADAAEVDGQEPDEQAEVADAEEAGDEPPRTVRVAGGGGGGGGGAEESEASGPTRGHPGAGGGGAEPVGGAASDEGPDIDRVEVGGGAKSDKPPKKKRPLRSRLSWLAFGLLSGWLLLGYGRYMVLGGSR